MIERLRHALTLLADLFRGPLVPHAEEETTATRRWPRTSRPVAIVCGNQREMPDGSFEPCVGTIAKHGRCWHCGTREYAVKGRTAPFAVAHRRRKRAEERSAMLRTGG